MTKANILEIGNDITLRTPKGHMAGFRWDGEKLIHSTGKTMRFVDSVAQEISQAVASFRPAEREQKYGYEINGEHKGEWEFIGVVGDAHGLYSRLVNPGTGIIKVAFAKEDLL